MAFLIRSRPDYDPAVKLRPLPPSYLREVTGPLGDDTDVMDVDDGYAVTSLPILATANDAREMVRFLKKRPHGVTVIEAMNSEPRRIFDARKVAAYEFWGIIQRENDRLHLTPLGHMFADTLDPECRLHRNILNGIPAYRLALEKIYDEGLDIPTHLDVLRYWAGLRNITGGESGNPQDMEAAVVCFFSLCHAAELGTSTVGKRGQPARLRVDMEQVAAFLAESFSEHVSDPPDAPGRREPLRRIQYVQSAATVSRVMISSSTARPDIGHLDSLLGLAGMAAVVTSSPEFESGLLPSSELSEMQQCQAGIFVISPDDCTRREDGTLSLRQDWLTKISVAAALFDWKVLLFWNGPLPPPEELSASGLNIVSSETLDWETSLEVVSRIKKLAV